MLGRAHSHQAGDQQLFIVSCFALRIILTRDCKTVVKLSAMAFNPCSGGDMSITRRPWLVFDAVLSFEGERHRIPVNGLQVDGYADTDATSPKVYCVVDVQSGLLLETIDCFLNRKRSERAPFYILNLLENSHKTQLIRGERAYQPLTWPRQSPAELVLCLSVIGSGWCVGTDPCHLLQATEDAHH